MVASDELPKIRNINAPTAMTRGRVYGYWARINYPFFLRFFFLPLPGFLIGAFLSLSSSAMLNLLKLKLKLSVVSTA